MSFAELKLGFSFLGNYLRWAGGGCEKPFQVLAAHFSLLQFRVYSRNLMLLAISERHCF